MFNGLGNNRRRTFAGISNGKVVIRPGKDQEPILYDHIEGFIKEISRNDRNVNGKPSKFIDIVISDGNNEEAVLSLYEDSTSTRSVILSLASLKDFKQKVRFSAYPRTNGNGLVFTNVALRVGGEKIPWICGAEEIPKVEREIYKGQEIIDPSKRNAFFECLLQDIQKNLAASLQNVPVNEASVDYDEYNGVDDGEDMPIG